MGIRPTTCRSALHGRMILVALILSACTSPPQDNEPYQLRLAVSLTPQELETFEVQLDNIRSAHPEWEIILETTPQAGLIEKITTQLAGDSLPDVIRIPGLYAQMWTRQGAFLDLNSRIESGPLDIADFYASPLEQFTWQGQTYGLPDTAAPDLVFYNQDMFDAAGIEYPSGDWTFEDMRTAAIQLTLDSQGHNPLAADFDPQDIQQWGWKSGVTFFWERDQLASHGGDPCVNEDCTLMDFTSPDILEAVEWWSSLVYEEHAALYDPFSGAQTGIPGDPLLAGKVAMGSGGYFLLGQLESGSVSRFAINRPLLNTEGERLSLLSTNGYVISARSEHPDQAWNLVLELIDPRFLRETWGLPGHSLPALRSATVDGLDPALTQDEKDVILDTMEYAQVYKPYSPSAFEVYAKTSDLFIQAMKGELPVADAMAQVEMTANQILAEDRLP